VRERSLVRPWLRASIQTPLFSEHVEEGDDGEGTERR